MKLRLLVKGLIVLLLFIIGGSLYLGYQLLNTGQSNPVQNELTEQPTTQSAGPLVTIAILCKDKGHCLSRYLLYLERQTFPKAQTLLYIRTNDNVDDSVHQFDQWLGRVGHLYHTVYYNTSSIDQSLSKYKPHDWNQRRFQVLGRIRQESIQFAQNHGSHYFVADCDNFLIEPATLTNLLSVQLPVVGPMLECPSRPPYSNYHNVADRNGYFQSNAFYNSILNRNVRGLIQVDVIHCTYLIQRDYLQYVSYLDPEQTGHHEYVLFSNHLRNQKIAQYLDNRQFYGILTFADTLNELQNEPWYNTTN